MVQLQKYFDIAIESPDGIMKMRELILTLAMQGKLVPQDPNDEPASTLIKEIFTVKRQLENDGHIKPSRHYDTISNIEVPYELPDGWEWCRLNHVLDVRDGTHDTPKYVDVGYPLITSKNLSSGTLSFDDVKYISEQDHQSISARSVVDRGDILFAMIGSIGNPVIVDCDTPFSIKNVALFKFYKSGLPVNRYIHLYLKSAEKTMKAKSSGAVQSFVSLGFLRDYLIPLPPLKEQTRIVEKVVQLMAVCDKIEGLQQRRDTIIHSAHSASIKRLLASDNIDDFASSWQFISKHFNSFYSVKENVAVLKKAILTLAMHGRLVPQDPNDKPAHFILNSMKEEKSRLQKRRNLKTPKPFPSINVEDMPYLIPQNWTWIFLGQASTLITKGSTPTTYGFSFQKDGIPFIKVENVKNGAIQFTDKMQYISDDAHIFQKRSILQGNDILFSIAGTIGETCLVKPSDLPANINQALALVRGYQSAFNADYLMYALNSIVAEKTKKKARGAAMNNISLTDLNEMCIPLPPQNEQKRIVIKINQLMELVDKLEEQINKSTIKQTELLNSVVSQEVIV